MGSYKSSLCVLLVHISPYASLWVFTGLYASLLIPIGSYGYFLSLYAFLLVLMSPFKALCVLMDSDGSFWVLICP